jgi:hypothetical protein
MSGPAEAEPQNQYSFLKYSLNCLSSSHDDGFMPD